MEVVLIGPAAVVSGGAPPRKQEGSASGIGELGLGLGFGEREEDGGGE